jgi:LAO/AO transport system kinase
VVNKADGVLTAIAQRSAADYRNALRFLRPRSSRWEVPVETCSALEGRGIDRTWALIEKYRDTMTASGDLAATRASQARRWLWSETAESLLALLREDPAAAVRMQALEQQVAAGKLSPRVAAQELVQNFWKDGRLK